MAYIPALIIALAVGVSARYLMPHKFLSLAANVALALFGGVMGVLLVLVAQPETTDVIADLSVLAALGGSVLAVLGGNWCYELTASDNPRRNPRIYKDDEPNTKALH